MLTISNLSKSFGTKKILNKVDLTVAPGEIAILLGSSGVGKSTLLRILNNLETYDTGSVRINGHPIDLASVNSTHKIGMVFQQFHLFEHLTALENITLALEKVQGVAHDDAKAQALDLLTQYGLQDKASAYPSGLSGGQKQRLALARMLALKPEILCLDEPTSALDPVLTAHVAQTIELLSARGLTVLITTHDVSLVQQLSTSSVHLMKNGHIVQSALSGQFHTHPEKYTDIAAFIRGDSV